MKSSGIGQCGSATGTVDGRTLYPFVLKIRLVIHSSSIYRGQTGRRNSSHPLFVQLPVPQDGLYMASLPAAGTTSGAGRTAHGRIQDTKKREDTRRSAMRVRDPADNGRRVSGNFELVSPFFLEQMQPAVPQWGHLNDLSQGEFMYGNSSVLCDQRYERAVEI